MSDDEKEESYFFGSKKGFNTVNETGKSHKFLWPKSKSNSMKALRYFKLKTAVDENILFASPGIYTWLLRGKTLYATQVESKQEIGTLHSNLYDFSSSQNNKGEIIAAGELEIKKEHDVINIRFNFLSGTYHKAFEKVRSERELIKIVTDKLLSLKIPELGVLGVSSVEYIGKTPLIDDSSVRANNTTMAALNAFFKKKTDGGGKRRTKRNKTKKRYVKK